MGNLPAFNTCTKGGCWAVFTLCCLKYLVPQSNPHQCTKVQSVHFLQYFNMMSFFPRFFLVCHWNSLWPLTSSETHTHRHTDRSVYETRVVGPFCSPNHSFASRLRRGGGRHFWWEPLKPCTSTERNPKLISSSFIVMEEVCKDYLRTTKVNVPSNNAGMKKRHTLWET